MKTRTSSKILAWSIFVVLLLWFEPTRKLVILLLPMGSGWDDIVFVVFAAVLLTIMLFKGVLSVPKWLRNLRREFKEEIDEAKDEREKWT